jgi:ubiquitin-like protein Pup
MAEQEKKQAPQRQTGEDAEVEEAAPAARSGRETADKIDELLEEIDAVLEENAEEFVKNYVQKGGQ